MDCEGTLDLILDAMEEKEEFTPRYHALKQVMRTLGLIDRVILDFENKAWREKNPKKALKREIAGLEFELKCLRENGLQ